MESNLTNNLFLQLGNKLLAENKPAMQWDDYHIIVQNLAVEELNIQFGGLFQLSFDRLKTLRQIPDQLQVMYLLKAEQLTSILVLAPITSNKFEIINIQTLPLFQNQSQATILINKGLEILHMNDVIEVITRNRTQWIEHPIWNHLLENSQAQLTQTPFTYFELQDQSKASELANQFLSNHNSIYRVRELDRTDNINWFREQILSIPFEGKLYLHPFHKSQANQMSAERSIVLESKGKLIGWFLVSEDDSGLTVYAMYIYPQYRGSRMAMRLILEFLRRNTDQLIRFMVRSENTIMLKMGYQFIVKRLGAVAKPQHYYTFHTKTGKPNK